MPELSNEVKNMLAGAKGLYEAMQRSKPTSGLAYALRDSVAFDKLADSELEVMCRFYKEVSKLAATAGAALPGAEANAAPTENGQGGEKPDEVIPPSKTAKPMSGKVGEKRS